MKTQLGGLYLRVASLKLDHVLKKKKKNYILSPSSVLIDSR